MNFVWICYMYKLDKGYFRYILDGTKSKYLSTGITIVAAASGIVASFTPYFTIVPIGMCGLLLAALLYHVSRSESVTTPFSRDTRQWAGRTALNMVFTFFLIPLHWFMITANKPFADARMAIDAVLPVSAKNLTLWLTAIFLLWFWAHIRPEQQSEISIAAKLAHRDASRPRQSA